MAAIEERSIHLYSSSQSILLVGEGDFSFSSDLATAFRRAPNILATSLDSRHVVEKKYPFARKALKNLAQLGAAILHGLDATKMQVLGDRRFDRIIFNFPHAGIMLGGGETNPSMVRENSGLMQKFFQNAGNRLTPGGQIHVNHKHVFPYTRWNLEQHAAACGLVLLRKEAFNLAKIRLELPTYCNRRGYGRRPNRTFPVKCDTFIFIKRTHHLDPAPSAFE